MYTRDAGFIEYAHIHYMGGEFVHAHVCACVLGEVKRTSGIKRSL